MITTSVKFRSLLLGVVLIAAGAWGAGNTNRQGLDVTNKSGSGIFTYNTSGTITTPNATDTLVGKATTDTLTNKTLTSPTLTTPTISSGATTFSALTATTVPYIDASKVLTSSAVTPTELGYSSGVTSSLCGINQSCTLTNKTLTAPVIATIVNTGTLTLPTSTDTLVGRATTDTLTNKTLTSPTFTGTSTAAGITMSGILSNTYAGTSGSSAVLLSGAPYAAGTSTTNKPQLLLQDASSSNAWSSAGSYLGVNAASGFTGNLIDAQVNASSKFSVTSAGNTTVAGTLGVASTISGVAGNFTGLLTDSYSGTSGSSALLLSGAPYAGGSATTNKPLFLIQDAGTSNAWSTSGSYLGVNAATGFVGNLIDAQLNAVSKFSVTSAGNTAIAGTLGVSGTISGVAENLTGILTDSYAGTSGSSAVLISGAPYAGGSATTNKPQLLIQDAGTSNAWSTAGSYFGVNAASGFTGSLIDAQLNASSKFSVDYTGAVTAGGTLTSAQVIDSGLTANTAVYANASKQLTSSATTPTQLAYLSSATGTTGTSSTNLVFSASPTLSGTITLPGSSAVSSIGAATFAPSTTANSTQYGVNAYNTVTTTSNGTYSRAGVASGISSTFSVNTARTDSGAYSSYLGLSERSQSGDVGTLTNLRGLSQVVGHNSPGSGATTTNLEGIYVQQEHNGAGTTVTNSYGLYIDTPDTSGGACTLTNTPWGVYQKDTASNNALAGNLRIGSTTAPTVALDVTGAAKISTTLNVTGSSTLAGGALSGTFSGAHTLSGSTVTFSGNTTSSSTGTGTVVVTGGVGVSENANVGGTLAVTGTSALTGHVGVVGASQATAGLAYAETITDGVVSTSVRGMTGAPSVAHTVTTGARTALVQGFLGNPAVDATNTQNWTGTVANNLQGLSGQPKITASATGTISNISGLYVKVANSASGATLTNSYGAYVESPTATGTITTAAGIAINEQTTGGKNTDLLLGTATIPTDQNWSINNQSTYDSKITAQLYLPGLSTGTNADTVCMATGGKLLIQAAACTISSRRFKENIQPLATSGLSEIMRMKPVTFNMINDNNVDNNYTKTQVGMIAEDVEAIDPRLTVYEQDGVTPKSYRVEAVSSILVKAMQEQQAQILALKTELADLRGRVK